MARSTAPLDVALEFTRAWTEHDFELAASYIAEDVEFDGPLQHSTGVQPYLEGLLRLSQSVKNIEVIAAFGDSEQALLMYDLSTEPYGKLRCAKCLIVHDGKITKDLLAFDSYSMRGN